MTATRSPLDALFQPRSIAVIGASADPHKIGGRSFGYIKQHYRDGALYAVNPSHPEVQGVPALASVADLPEGVELGIVVVPAPLVPAAVEQCGAKGLRTLVIFSSGFAEVGGGGVEAQARIAETARKYGMRIVGPNCMGVMNVPRGLWGTFSASFVEHPPLPGGVSMVSQSGAFGIYCYQAARNRGLGLNLWATTGNEVDVDVADCLDYVARDEHTDVIICYMEGARDKTRLFKALEEARQRRKPVIMLKVGRSAVGAAAASSHTASLAGADAVYDAVFEQFGVYRANTIDELVEVAYACAAGLYPRGRRLGLVTVSGGVGALMADAASECAMEVPPLPEPAQRKLLELIPFAAVRNPVDTTAMMLNDPTLLRRNMEVMLAEGGCDAVIFFLSSVGLNTELMQGVVASMAELRTQFPEQPVSLSGIFAPQAAAELEQLGYFVCSDPSRAVEQMAALAKLREAFDRPLPDPAALPLLPEAARTLSPGAQSSAPLGTQSTAPLGEAAAKRILAAAGIPVIEERLATTADEARAAAQTLGYPVVLKIASPDIAHKSEIGGVLLNVADGDAAVAGFATLIARARTAAPEAHLDGVLVAPMIDQDARGGVETILGVQRDPVFGPVVLFGLGGVFVEVLRDVVLRVAPFGEAEARQMIAAVKGYPLLDGARGRPKADVAALAQALSRLSVFAAHHADAIETLDINPFVVFKAGEGALALDALIVKREGS